MTIRIEDQLTKLLLKLIDQHNAAVVIPPYENTSGCWFGGGNLVQDVSGHLWLCGRYRNSGDSRVGLEAGARGIECAVFCSTDKGKTFSKVHSWSKADLSRDDRRVLSIEGTALHRLPDGTWELFISSEKELPYPQVYRTFQKQGTGVWSIDRITGTALSNLSNDTITSVLENHDEPGYLHIKDPVVYDDAEGNTLMIFCSHPISWASSNSGIAARLKHERDFQVQRWQLVDRGPIWDVAATRITGRLPLPRVGRLADLPAASIYFYDGAECLRQHSENVRAFSRPRGYSCEELGGAFFGYDENFPQMQRLSQTTPLFASPHGTGCSRYVSTLSTGEGIFAIWQQSQPDYSQPLVMNFLTNEEIRQILSTD